MLLILKPTDACNAGCVYCSAFYGDLPDRKRMSLKTFRLIIDKASAYLRSKRKSRLQILWHGGEPLLMGAEFYKNVLQACEDCSRKHDVEISHIMQSNLHLLDEKTAPVIAELLSQGAMSSSFDVVEGIRLTGSSSQKYMESFQKGLHQAVEAAIRVNAVYVVHKKSLERVEDILAFFRENPLYALRFNPLIKLGRALNDPLENLYISSREWGEFLLDVYHHLKKGSLPKSVAPFEEWGFWGPEKKPKRSALSCNFNLCMEGIISFDSKGDAYGCGKMADIRIYPFGNISDHPFEDFLRHPQRMKILSRKIYLRNTLCAECPYWEYCRGGCPMDGYEDGIYPYKKTFWCEGIRFFLEKAGIKGNKSGKESLRIFQS